MRKRSLPPFNAVSLTGSDDSSMFRSNRFYEKSCLPLRSLLKCFPSCVIPPGMGPNYRVMTCVGFIDGTVIEGHT